MPMPPGAMWPTGAGQILRQKMYTKEKKSGMRVTDTTRQEIGEEEENKKQAKRLAPLLHTQSKLLQAKESGERSHLSHPRYLMRMSPPQQQQMMMMWKTRTASIETDPSMRNESQEVKSMSTWATLTQVETAANWKENEKMRKNIDKPRKTV
jgi:hypothetical protein